MLHFFLPFFLFFAGLISGSFDTSGFASVKTSDAVIAAGGTITHHHAVGRDHRPWYDKQRPDPFAAALKAAKKAVDPESILNPGVLIDP